MRIVFSDSAWNDYLWFQANNRQLLKRINLLIKDCQRDPYDGIG
jgi:toxin YoeB